MKISIICVGKIKEKFYSQAVDEYMKRLTRYCKPFVVELPDEKTPEGCSQTVCDQIKAKEGERILGALKGDEYVISLDVYKRQFLIFLPILQRFLSMTRAGLRELSA